MLSATFNDRGGGANYPAFSVDLTSSTAIFRSPEILQIFRRNCYTSQGDPDSSFPLWKWCNLMLVPSRPTNATVAASIINKRWRQVDPPMRQGDGRDLY